MLLRPPSCAALFRVARHTFLHDRRPFAGRAQATRGRNRRSEGGQTQLKSVFATATSLRVTLQARPESESGEDGNRRLYPMPVSIAAK